MSTDVKLLSQSAAISGDGAAVTCSSSQICNFLVEFFNKFYFTYWSDYI